MAASWRTRVTLALVQPAAIHPNTAIVVTQYSWLRLPSGKLVKAFEGNRDDFFRPNDVGMDFSVIFQVEAGDFSIEKLEAPRKSFSQEGHTATIEGPIEHTNPDTPERNRVVVDAGECCCQFFAGTHLKIGDFVRASGRLEVRDKRRI